MFTNKTIDKRQFPFQRGVSFTLNSNSGELKYVYRVDLQGTHYMCCI